MKMGERAIDGLTDHTLEEFEGFRLFFWGVSKGFQFAILVLFLLLLFLGICGCLAFRNLPFSVRIPRRGN